MRRETFDLLFESRELRGFRPAPPPGGGGFYGGGGGGAGGGGGDVGAATGAGAAAAAGSGGGSSAYNEAAWLFTPSTFKDIDKYNSVVIPAINATSVILTFKVKSGRMAKVTALGIDFQANGNSAAGTVFLQGVLPFQLTFFLTNSAPGSGWQDFASFNYLPGSVSTPMAIPGLMASEGQTITLSVKNNSIVVGATPQYIGAHIQGYDYSKKQHPKGLGNQ